MSTATFERATTIQASEEEHSVIEAVQSFLASQLAKSTKLVGQDGQTILLSAALYEVLRQAALVLVQDEAVAIVPVHKLLTTNDAADILNISRPSLIQILERGELPYMMVGTHRRIRFGDLLSYKEARDARRRAALDRLVEQSEELGLYDRTQAVATFGVTLDACVLYPARLRDTLLLAAERNLYRPQWTDEILAELRRNLVTSAPMTDAKADGLIESIRVSFEHAVVVGYEPLIPAMPT